MNAVFVLASFLVTRDHLLWLNRPDDSREAVVCTLRPVRRVFFQIAAIVAGRRFGFGYTIRGRQREVLVPRNGIAGATVTPTSGRPADKERIERDTDRDIINRRSIVCVHPLTPILHSKNERIAATNNEERHNANA